MHPVFQRAFRIGSQIRAQGCLVPMLEQQACIEYQYGERVGAEREEIHLSGQRDGKGEQGRSRGRR